MSPPPAGPSIARFISYAYYMLLSLRPLKSRCFSIPRGQLDSVVWNNIYGAAVVRPTNRCCCCCRRGCRLHRLRFSCDRIPCWGFCVLLFTFCLLVCFPGVRRMHRATGWAGFCLDEDSTGGLSQSVDSRHDAFCTQCVFFRNRRRKWLVLSWNRFQAN